MPPGGALSMVACVWLVRIVLGGLGAPPENHFNYGNVLFAEGRYLQAESAFRRAFNHPGLKGNAYYNAGNAAFCRGDFSKALDYFESALSITPEDEDAWHNLEMARARLQARKEEQTPEETSRLGGEQPDFRRPPKPGAEPAMSRIEDQALQRAQQAEAERQSYFQPLRGSQPKGWLQDVFSLPPEQLADLIREETRAGYPFRPGRSLRPQRKSQGDRVDW